MLDWSPDLAVREWLELMERFNPSQKRDNDGRWTDGGGGGSSGAEYVGRRRAGGGAATGGGSGGAGRTALASYKVQAQGGPVTVTRNSDGGSTVDLGGSPFVLSKDQAKDLSREMYALGMVEFGITRAGKAFTVGSQRTIPFDGDDGEPLGVATRTGKSEFEIRLRSDPGQDPADAPAFTITGKDANRINKALGQYDADQAALEKRRKEQAREDNRSAGRSNPADAARRATGRVPTPHDPDRQGMPDAVASVDIPLAKGGGSVTVHKDPAADAVHVSANGKSFALSLDEISAIDLSVRGADDDGLDDGESDWITDPEGFRFGQVTKTGKTYRVDIDGQEAFTLTPKDAGRIERAAEGVQYSSRLETASGPVDLYADGKRLGIRHLGDDGRPVETSLTRTSGRAIERAMNTVNEGFDEEDEGGPDSGLTRKDVKTNAGPVRVELDGQWGSPGGRLTIGPIEGEEWGIVIDGPNMDSFHDRFGQMLEESARPLGELTPLSEASGDRPTGRRFRARLIKGDTQGSSGYYPARMLAENARVFAAGLPMYIDHPSLTEQHDRPERSMRDLAGKLVTPARYDGDGLYADVEVYPHWVEFVQAVWEDTGISIRASGTVETSTAPDIPGPIVTSLAAAESVDFVTAAGAGGKIVALLESARAEGGELLRQAAEALAPPFKKKDAKDRDADEKPDGTDDGEGEESGEDDDTLPPFIKAKIKAKAKASEARVSEARNVGHWLESRLHRTFTEMADDMFGEGRLSRDERIALSQAIGEGLTAFNAKVADQMPHLYERDLWDDPTPPVAADAANTENPAPIEVAESKHEPGSSPAVENEREVGMPELTEDQARELQEARTAAEADKAAALQEAADAKLMLARFTALEAARPIAVAVLAESGLPAGAQAKLLAAVSSESVPLNGENALDESALKASVEEAAKAESTYLASLAEGEGAGRVRGLGEAATGTASHAPDAATVTALEETYRSRGLSPDAARLAAVGRP